VPAPTAPLASATNAAPSASEVVLTFLESVGRRSEAELYLRLFRQLPKESFALIAPGAPVLREGVGALVEQLHFLAELGLFAPLILGLFDPESAAPSAERLSKRLPSAGLVPTLHLSSEPDLAENLRAELRSERLPMVLFGPDAGTETGDRIGALAALARSLDTRKIVLLRRRGGIPARGDRPIVLGPGHTLSASGGWVSVVNLRTDLGALLSAKRFGKRDLELVEAANGLLQSSGSNVLVSVTSPLNLLRELFTVKGAGTLIKAGTEIERRDDYDSVDVGRLRPLLEGSFGRTLAADFFERRPLAVYYEASYRGAAILHAAAPAPYLTKFAVMPEAQGEGIGHDLWHAIERDFPRIFWRARPDNPIAVWYQSECDGMLRRPHWTIYFRGLDPERIPELVVHAEAMPSDFVGPREAASGSL
jgi:acetylglutamate kinase